MGPLLNRDDFPGPSLSAADVIDAFMGEARFDGAMNLVSMRRADVEGLLAPELTLASNESTTPDIHPVLFMFGALRKTTILLGGAAIPTGVDYPEFLMAIPYVRHRSGRNLHTFMARMFSGVPTSVFVGNTLYGFAKSLACMRWEGPIFTVMSPFPRSLQAHAAVGKATAGGTPTAALAAMTDALSLPIVGKRSDGALASSYFEVDFAAGSVAPTDTWVSVDTPFIPALSPQRFYADSSRSVRITDVMWRLSWPLRCRL